MIGLDTNVLVCFLVRDHPAQYERSRHLIETQVASGQPVFVSLVIQPLLIFSGLVYILV